MSCTQMATAPACYNDGTSNIDVVAHYEYGKDADGDVILVATRYTDAAGVVVDTSAGTVTAGVCPLPPSPDVETKTLCDNQGGGVVVRFCRTTITSFDDAGAVAARTVSDFELDGTTAYVPAGTVEDCNDDCPVEAAQGVLVAWG